MEALHGPVALSDPLRRAAGFLEGLLDVERLPEVPYARLGLDSISALLARVGEPQRDLSVVHIGGSKGKGSTSLFVESILAEAGERVGTFTSPHLSDWTERFRIDRRPIAPEALAGAVERLRPHVEALRREDPARAPTFFDATTAVAFVLFREARVDRAVLEVGLGGRLDSTNVVDPTVSCIASVELEHTDRLGSTLAEIAQEKAGIVKRGRPIVIGSLPAEAEEVVDVRARELDAPLARLGREFVCKVGAATLDGVELQLRDGGWCVRTTLGVAGRHQSVNAALAAACVKRLAGTRTEDEDQRMRKAVARGLSAARLPGRIEVLGRRPWLVVDSAHTPVSARALAKTLAPVPRRRTHFVLSISAGKDLGRLLATWLPGADEVTVTRAEPRRSLAPDEIAAAVRQASPQTAIHVVPNPFLAVRSARERLAPDDLLCATGSVYLAGIARRVLKAD